MLFLIFILYSYIYIYNSSSNQSPNNLSLYKMSMLLLSKMNDKLDMGYKLTNFSCTYCKGVTLAKINSPSLYCPKCDK